MNLEPVVASLRYQREGLTTSPLYQFLLGVTIDDAERGGICSEVLARTPEGVDPVLDALPLRFLGGLHRVVLDGGAPALAAFYPSAGGRFDEGTSRDELTSTFLATIADQRDAVIASLGLGVQTNEVGRCAALLPGFLHVAAVTALPLHILEIGASAGLNLRWDRYRYEGGEAGSSWGDATSPLVFADVFAEPRPDLSAPATVTGRRGCDRSPIDAGSVDGAQRLRSFVWPDQLSRFRALDAALRIAHDHPVVVDRADAAEWVVECLAQRPDGAATVFYQSIVWQYLPSETRSTIRDAIRGAGARTTSDAPLAWLRMEPGADPQKGAEVRLTLWPDGFDGVLVTTGYHGRPVSMALRG